MGHSANYDLTAMLYLTHKLTASNFLTRKEIRQTLKLNEAPQGTGS